MIGNPLSLEAEQEITERESRLASEKTGAENSRGALQNPLKCRKSEGKGATE